MEKFRNQLIKRRSEKIALLAAIVCIFAGSGVIHRVFNIALSTGHLQAFSIGFSVGILIAALGFLVKEIIECEKALKSENKLRKLYIKETDERVKLIREKIGGKGLDLLFFVIVLAAAISSFWNTMVSITLIAVTGCIAIIKLALKAYYWKKY